MIATALLALATIAFVGTHLALSHPLRLRLVQNLGEARFAALYSVVAFVTLGLMILAWFGTVPGTALWIAPDYWWPVASGLMLLASILLLGSLRGNPAMPFPGALRAAAQPPTGVYAITRHPMNWSFILWAAVHISLWGEARNLIVAGGILVLALAGSIGQDRKKRSVLGRKWLDWEARTSFVPFGALLTRRLPWRAARPDAIALGGGLAFWLIVTWLHAPSFSPIAAVLDR